MKSVDVRIGARDRQKLGENKKGVGLEGASLEMPSQGNDAAYFRSKTPGFEDTA